MLRLNELKLPLNHTEDELPAAIIARLGIAAADLLGFTIYKRSYDARKKTAIVLIYSIDIELNNEAVLRATSTTCTSCRRRTPAINSSPTAPRWPPARLPAPGGDRHRPVRPAGGADPGADGPAPIIVERGKIVRERTVDTFGFWRQRKLNPESNVQFGEGGAGTFSDGKLYSQIKDPKHYGRKVLTEFVKAGAPEEIIYVSKPHIGTFRLVKMVESMRETIERWAANTASRARSPTSTSKKPPTAARCAASCWKAARRSSPTTWCWPSATARATPSRCCTSAACTSRPSRSRSASASSTRSR
jgi:uncharacterized FAD-dependent dehydrogenase